MSMTKAEQAMVEGLRVRLALCHTTLVDRDVPAPTHAGRFGAFTEGWEYRRNTHGNHPGEAYAAWSESTAHGDGPHPSEGRARIGSQGARSLYSSKVRALQALRNSIEQSAAAQLRAVDKAIESAQSEVPHVVR